MAITEMYFFFTHPNLLGNSSCCHATVMKEGRLSGGG